MKYTFSGDISILINQNVLKIAKNKNLIKGDVQSLSLSAQFQMNNIKKDEGKMGAPTSEVMNVIVKGHNDGENLKNKAKPVNEMPSHGTLL